MLIFKQLKYAPLSTITIIAAIILFICSSVRHLLFQSSAFEMGIYDQVTYLISQGLPPISSFLEVHHLGNHAAWSMYPVALLYKIYPSVYWLLLIQAICLAIGTIPTWSLARHAGLNKKLAFAMAIVYLSYPVIFNLNLFDFHPEVMALPAMLGAILAAKLDKTLWFCIAIIWVLGCKGALSLPIAGMGFWLYFYEKKRLCGAIALFAGTAWFIIATQLLIPYFRDGQPPGGVGRYRYLGSSIQEILLNMFLRPELVLGKLISLKTLEYLLLLNLPVIWWLAPKYLTPLIAASPVFAMNILSKIDAQRDLIHQYSLPILPFLLMAVIYTIADGKCGLWYWLWNLRKPQTDKTENISTIVGDRLPKFIIIWSCIGFLALAKYGYFWSIYLDELDTWQAAREAIALVDTKDGVLTTSEITPHLTHRQFIKLIVEEDKLPTNEALDEYDYVLVNVRHPGWKSSQEYSTKLVDKLKVNSEFQLSYERDDVYLFEKIDGKTDRQGWVVWEEEGRYPDVIVELTSPSTASVDIGKKKDIYEGTFRTPYYFIFNPFDGKSLEGWYLENKKYQKLQRNDRGWLWCEELELWLGTWEGTILQESAVWLRFYDSQGNLVLLPGEVAEQERQRAEQESQRADQERQRAESLAAKLKELGVDPDSV